jgi:transcriptional regulator with XRE-family HTH domain
MVTNEAIIFWSRVKRIIKKKNATQAKIAETCGFSLQTFHGWMYKGVWPTVFDAFRIARVLGVSLEYLMIGKDIQEEEIETRIKNVRSLLEKASMGLDEII